MILVYGDESLDETGSRVCSVVAVVGTEEQWKATEFQWCERNGAIPFHAKDCESNRGDYAPQLGEDEGSKNGENKALYRDLISILAQSGLAGFASTVDISAQKAAFPEMPQNWTYPRALVDVIEFMKTCAADIGDIAVFTFDNRVESEFNATLVYKNLREETVAWNAHLAPELSFGNSRNNPRIQIADLFVREAMKDLDNLIGPKRRPTRKSWIALRETRRFVAYNFSTDWFRDLAPHLPDLAKQAGFTRQDYLAWLAQRNRQDNLTAYLEFFHWNKTQNRP